MSITNSNVSNSNIENVSIVSNNILAKCHRVPKFKRGKGVKVPWKGNSYKDIGKEGLELCKQTSFGCSPLGLCYKPSHLNGWENN